MKVFYCWTFYQFLNMVNIKSEYFRDENAILYIADFENTNRYQTNIQYCNDRKLFIEIEKVDFASISNGGLSNDKLAKYFLNEFKGNKVDEIFLPGFWVDSLKLVRALYTLNHNIKISLVEEGINAPTIKQLYWDLPFLKRLYYGGPTYYRYKTHIVDYYRYDISPEKEMQKYHHMPLHKVVKGTFCYSMLKEGNEKPIESIQEASCIFLDGNFRKDIDENLEDVYKKVFGLINKYTSSCIVRLHPSGLQRSKIFDDIGVTIDRTNVTLENISVRNNLDGKIFITSNSSGAINMKRVFGYDTYLILLYKILNPAENMSYVPNLPVDNEYVFAPESLQGFDSILRSLKDRIKNNQ